MRISPEGWSPIRLYAAVARKRGITGVRTDNYCRANRVKRTVRRIDCNERLGLELQSLVVATRAVYGSENWL